MKSFVTRLAIIFAITLCNINIGYSQIINLGKCQETIEACKDGNITPKQYDFIISQCRNIVDTYIYETDRIKHITSIDKRKVEADKVNQKYSQEYDLYEQMIRILKRAVNEEDKNLGRLNKVEASRVLNDNKYINSMFTIFRSRYSF